jgi:hypothetical protein
MIPVLIFYLVKRFKLNTSLSKSKIEVKKIASRVKAFLFGIAVISSLAFTKDKSEVLTYHVIKNDAIIGTININKTVLDNSVIYSSESQIKAKFLITFNVATKEKAVFKNGVLVYSSIFRTINSKTKTNNEIVFENGQYLLQTSENSQSLNFNKITQNLVTLYFNEPNGASSVFCDNLRTMVKIIPLGDCKYKVELSSGAFNIFHYQNGKCIKIEAVSNLYNVTLIPLVS